MRDSAFRSDGEAGPSGSPTEEQELQAAIIASIDDATSTAWTCKRCTFYNDVNHNVCAMCQTPRDTSSAEGPAKRPIDVKVYMGVLNTGYGDYKTRIQNHIVSARTDKTTHLAFVDPDFWALYHGLPDPQRRWEKMDENEVKTFDLTARATKEILDDIKNNLKLTEDQSRELGGFDIRGVYVTIDGDCYKPLRLPRQEITNLFQWFGRPDSLRQDDSELGPHTTFLISKPGSSDVLHVHFFRSIDNLKFLIYLYDFIKEKKGVIAVHNNIIFYGGRNVLMDEGLERALKELSNQHGVTYTLNTQQNIEITIDVNKAGLKATYTFERCIIELKDFVNNVHRTDWIGLKQKWEGYERKPPCLSDVLKENGIVNEKNEWIWKKVSHDPGLK